MAAVVHTIDAHADAVIVLRNPSVRFAVWEDDEELVPDELVPDELVPNELIPEELVPEELVPEERGPEEPVPEEPDSEEPASPSESTNHGKEIHYHVSAKHLRLASARFESALSAGNWKEGIPDETDGLYHISAEDWDESAFLILLNALHLRTRQIPRTLSLEMLAKIAVLVDYYGCAEAVELWTEKWIEHLRDSSPIPSTYCRDLILWMCVAWVFRLPNEFAEATAIAMKRSRQEELSTLGLPLSGFVDHIDPARDQAIAAIISQLHDLLEEYHSPTYSCPTGYSFECGSILYGALTKELISTGLLVPCPVDPSSGWTLGRIYSKVHNIKSPTWYDAGSRRWGQHSCNLNEKVTEVADRVMVGVNGLRLEDFDRT